MGGDGGGWSESCVFEVVFVWVNRIGFRCSCGKAFLLYNSIWIRSMHDITITLTVFGPCRYDSVPRRTYARLPWERENFIQGLITNSIFSRVCVCVCVCVISPIPQKKNPPKKLPCHLTLVYLSNGTEPDLTRPDPTGRRSGYHGVPGDPFRQFSINPKRSTFSRILFSVLSPPPKPTRGSSYVPFFFGRGGWKEEGRMGKGKGGRRCAHQQQVFLLGGGGRGYTLYIPKPPSPMKADLNGLAFVRSPRARYRCRWSLLLLLRPSSPSHHSSRRSALTLILRPQIPQPLINLPQILPLLLLGVGVGVGDGRRRRQIGRLHDGWVLGNGVARFMVAVGDGGKVGEVGLQAAHVFDVFFAGRGFVGGGVGCGGRSSCVVCCCGGVGVSCWRWLRGFVVGGCRSVFGSLGCGGGSSSSSSGGGAFTLLFRCSRSSV